MTVQTTPGFLQNAAYPAAIFRQAISAPYILGGPVGEGELVVSAQSTPNMSVVVGPGRAKVPGTQAAPQSGTTFTTQAMYDVLNDAPVSVTIAAADQANPRIDLVYVGVQDSFYSGSANTAIIGVVTGMPASSPKPPALPANSVALASLSITANLTSVLAANITNTGGLAQVQGAHMDAPTLMQLQAVTGRYLWTEARVYADPVTTNNGLYVWTGSTWVMYGVPAPITSLGGGWTGLTGAEAPVVTLSGGRVYLDGAVTYGSTSSVTNILTIPAAFIPPTKSTRFVGMTITSTSASFEYTLNGAGTLGLASGYGGGSFSAGAVLPLAGLSYAFN